MATPTSKTYIVASGATITAGRYGPAVTSLSATAADALFSGSASRGPAQASFTLFSDASSFSGSVVIPSSPNTALVGDSLTSSSFGFLHPYQWLISLNGGKLKTIANIAVAGQTTSQILARIDNQVTDASPGLAGLPRLGFVITRTGTNTARYGGNISAGDIADYRALFAKYLTYADYVIVMPVPPVGTASGQSGAGVGTFNSFLQSECAANPRLKWVDDCVTVNNGSGDWAPGYAPADGIHFGSATAYQMGIDGAAAAASWLAAFGLPSPVSSAAGDVYPTQPQWAPAPNMAGTSGVNSLGSGAVPTGYSISSNRSGLTVNSSIVAADAGDPNQAPWLRLTPAVIVTGTGELIMMSVPLSSAAITTSYPEQLDVVWETRFNNFAGAKFGDWTLSVYGNAPTEILTLPVIVHMGGTINGRAVFRSALHRTAAGRSSHASASLQWFISTAANFSGPMGSFDIRCLTIRG